MSRRRLTIFSAAERRYCEPLLRGFAGHHPEIDIDFVFGISTDLHRRFLNDEASGAPPADLFWSSAMDQQMSLVLDGHAQPHGVRHGLPAGAAYRDLAVATTCEPIVTLARDVAAPAGAPAEIAALIHSDVARFRGRIAVPDIETNGLGFVAMLWWALKDPAFDGFLEALLRCEPRAVGSAPALIAAMAGGAELALHLLGAYAERAVAADPALTVAQSALPSMAVARVAFIPRRAANPEAASVFLGYMLSPEGQAAIGEAGLFPINAQQARPVTPIPLGEDFFRLLDPAFRASVLTRWRAALGRTQDQNRRKQA
ncbi:MAG: substrate-binding domain-containing protein [Xanthobacteraceae bacterium]|nr:substrate-binding domain-containing protein [Xanthobacteraceae bacterium]